MGAGWQPFVSRSLLKHSLQPVDDAFKKRGNAQPVMVVEVYKNGEDDNGYDDKPFKQVSEQDEQAGYDQQHDPANMERAKLIVVLIHVIKQRLCAALVNVACV